jgi:hypothetical protein
VLNTGGYVALALVLLEVVLVLFFASKMTRTAFGIASLTILFLAMFFWVGDRVTEIIIPTIGTIKTAADIATQYVQDIKNIKTEVEQQKEAIDAEAKKALTTDHIINELAENNDQAAAQLGQVKEQLAQAKKLADELQQKQDYWEVAKLTVLGTTGIAGQGLSERSAISDLLSPHVKLQPRLWIDCTGEAMTAYGAVIKMNDRFPFSYYYRGMCNRLNHVKGWQQDFEKAKSILLITTTIPGHNQNHDEVLKLIETDDLTAQVPPGFVPNVGSPP